MLTINRKFTVSVRAFQAEVIIKKLEEFNITVLKRSYYETTVSGRTIVKFFVDCECDEDTLAQLIENLKVDDGCIANIRF